MKAIEPAGNPISHVRHSVMIDMVDGSPLDYRMAASSPQGTPVLKRERPTEIVWRAYYRRQPVKWPKWPKKPCLALISRLFPPLLPVSRHSPAGVPLLKSAGKRGLPALMVEACCTVRGWSHLATSCRGAGVSPVCRFVVVWASRLPVPEMLSNASRGRRRRCAQHPLGRWADGRWTHGCASRGRALLNAGTLPLPSGAKKGERREAVGHRWPLPRRPCRMPRAVRPAVRWAGGLWCRFSKNDSSYTHTTSGPGQDSAVCFPSGRNVSAGSGFRNRPATAERQCIVRSGVGG